MSAIYANATKWILLLKYTAPSEQQTPILRFPLCSFWQHSFQWWFVFSFLYLFICITHCGEVDWDEDTDWGQSQREGGRERGKTRRDNERQKVKWKTSLPLPLGLISFGPQWSSPSNHHHKQSAGISASNPVMWLQICFQQGQDRKWESQEKVNEQERMSDSSLSLHVHHLLWGLLLILYVKRVFTFA